MSRHEHLEALAKGHDIEATTHSKLYVPVVCRATGLHLIETPEPFLRERRRQRLLAIHANHRETEKRVLFGRRLRRKEIDLSGGGRVAIEQPGQRSDRRRLKESRHGQASAERSLNRVLHADREQRVPAKIEEIVVDAGRGHAQMLRPDAS